MGAIIMVVFALIVAGGVFYLASKLITFISSSERQD